MTTRPLASLIARALLAYALVVQAVFGGATMGLAGGWSLAGGEAALGLCHGGADDSGADRHLPACCQTGCLPHALLPGAIDQPPLARRPRLVTFAGPAPTAVPPRFPAPFEATGPPPAA